MTHSELEKLVQALTEAVGELAVSTRTLTALLEAQHDAQVAQHEADLAQAQEEEDEEEALFYLSPKDRPPSKQ